MTHGRSTAHRASVVAIVMKALCRTRNNTGAKEMRRMTVKVEVRVGGERAGSSLDVWYFALTWAFFFTLTPLHCSSTHRFRNRGASLISYCIDSPNCHRTNIPFSSSQCQLVDMSLNWPVLQEYWCDTNEKYTFNMSVVCRNVWCKHFILVTGLCYTEVCHTANPGPPWWRTTAWQHCRTSVWRPAAEGTILMDWLANVMCRSICSRSTIISFR